MPLLPPPEGRLLPLPARFTGTGPGFPNRWPCPSLMPRRINSLGFSSVSIPSAVSSQPELRAPRPAARRAGEAARELRLSGSGPSHSRPDDSPAPLRGRSERGGLKLSPPLNYGLEQQRAQDVAHDTEAEGSARAALGFGVVCYILGALLLKPVVERRR